MKMKKNLVVWLCMLVLTMGYFKGYCSNEEASKTQVKKAWELGTRFTTDPGLYLKWYNDLEKRVAEQRDKPLDDVIIEFKRLIDSDPIVRIYLTEMIDQAKPKPGGSSLETPYLKDVDDMLKKIDAVLNTAPIYEDSGLVGFPINAILIDTMATPSGYAAFRNEKINCMFKKIINRWAQYLDSKDSLYVINDSPQGWKCAEAQEKLDMDQYKYDPNDVHWGFKSWNDFFTRKFKDDKQRPIAEQSNNKVIVSACDSQIFQIYNKVKKSDRFWIKSQPYSLDDMFGKEIIDQFVGGDVYQAFLNAFSYHRWHSPVSGTIIKTYNIPGTYYSQTEAVGKDPSGPDKSQGYIAQTAARAMILIQADDPVIGLMAVMPVGMAEVSSCVITVYPGQKVKKGAELGYFQFGGSTYCLIFRPGVIKEFTVKVKDVVKMGEKIAIAN